MNHVYFSPDGQWVASASFDKSVKLWNGTTGKFVAAFRGHVGPVYQIRFELFLLFLFKLILSFTQTIIMFHVTLQFLIKKNVTLQLVG